MSTQRWNDERLERLAETVENLAGRIQNITSLTENNAHLIESNARVIQALANVAAEAREERDRIFQQMAQQQTEIVGLRTETARMLEILLNERNQGDNPTA